VERTDTVEIGLKRAVGQFRFDAAAYDTNFQCILYKWFTGIGCSEFGAYDTATPGHNLLNSEIS
jgi:iron complex outermembrane recepter protein